MRLMQLLQKVNVHYAECIEPEDAKLELELMIDNGSDGFQVGFFDDVKLDYENNKLTLKIFPENICGSC